MAIGHRRGTGSGGHAYSVDQVVASQALRAAVGTWTEVAVGDGVGTSLAVGSAEEVTLKAGGGRKGAGDCWVGAAGGVADAVMAVLAVDDSSRSSIDLSFPALQSAFVEPTPISIGNVPTTAGDAVQSQRRRATSTPLNQTDRPTTQIIPWDLVPLITQGALSWGVTGYAVGDGRAGKETRWGRR